LWVGGCVWGVGGLAGAWLRVGRAGAWAVGAWAGGLLGLGRGCVVGWLRAWAGGWVVCGWLVGGLGGCGCGWLCSWLGGWLVGWVGGGGWGVCGAVLSPQVHEGAFVVLKEKRKRNKINKMPRPSSTSGNGSYHPCRPTLELGFLRIPLGVWRQHVRPGHGLFWWQRPLKSLRSLGRLTAPPLASFPSSAGALVLWSSGPVVLWSSGPLVLWSSGPLVLWSSGPLVLWSSGPLVLWY
jgi:hypothetical protein